MASAVWMSSVTAHATRLEEAASCCFCSGDGLNRTYTHANTYIRTKTTSLGTRESLISMYQCKKWRKTKTNGKCNYRSESITFFHMQVFDLPGELAPVVQCIQLYTPLQTWALWSSHPHWPQDGRPLAGKRKKKNYFITETTDHNP